MKNWRWGTKALNERTGLDTPVVEADNDECHMLGKFKFNINNK